MTPLPKNKITRAERGKRRAGNTPQLRRNPSRAKVPQYKDRLVQKLKMAWQVKATESDDKVQRGKLADKLAKRKR
jgi:hypothetical protein